MGNAKISLKRSRKISIAMKNKIEKYVTSSSKYRNGVLTGLKKPSILNSKSKKAKGVSMGADKNGFFVYTHRARSKSKKTPNGITAKEINFIESTG